MGMYLHDTSSGGDTAVSDDTGTRELADGRPSYRLVRREDIELGDALPGRSNGLTTCRLVGGSAQSIASRK